MAIKIFIIHGNFSGPRGIEPLEKTLKDRFKIKCSESRISFTDPEKIEFSRPKYDFSQTLVACASSVYKTVNSNIDPNDFVFLIGHSQGGLVARLIAVMMAGCTLKATYDCETLRKMDDQAYDDYMVLSRTLTPKYLPKKPYIDGVATLGSPHAGAFTMGQFSTAAGLFAKALQEISSLWARNLKDLSSDRLPQLMQYMHVPNTNYLSTSGSRINRYSLSWDGVVTDAANLGLPKLLAESALVPNFSVQLSKPNDLIVEEESADLTRSLLPFEGELDPEHFNSYVNATSVTHSSICWNNAVAEKIVDWLIGIAIKRAER